MRSLLLIATLLLTGCVAQHDSNGNYSDYPLTTAQARQVATDVATELAGRYPAKTVFSFPHDPSGAFSTALESAIRGTGRGVNPDVRPGLHRLTFRLTALNDHQFFISITVNQQHIQMVWSDDDGLLTRLQTITQGEVAYE
jgi:hypothetical protein